MTYYESAGVYHDRQRCTRAHATGDRIRRVETTDDLDACPVCVDEADDDDDPEICTAELSSGGECGREKPCPYHD